jgi:uncharacterized protein (TIGR02246 family)
MPRTTFYAALLIAGTVAGLPASGIAEQVTDRPAALLSAWAAAYAAQEGQRSASLYTPEARLWGSVSREQTVGQADIATYFGRIRPGAAAIEVRFGAHAVREVAPGVAVASGHYTFLRELWDGSIVEEPSRFSMTLVRGVEGGWRIVDHHSSRLPGPGR